MIKKIIIGVITILICSYLALFVRNNIEYKTVEARVVNKYKHDGESILSIDYKGIRTELNRVTAYDYFEVGSSIQMTYVKYISIIGKTTSEFIYLEK